MHFCEVLTAAISGSGIKQHNAGISFSFQSELRTWKSMENYIMCIARMAMFEFEIIVFNETYPLVVLVFIV